MIAALKATVTWLAAVLIVIGFVWSILWTHGFALIVLGLVMGWWALYLEFSKGNQISGQELETNE